MALQTSTQSESATDLVPCLLALSDAINRTGRDLALQGGHVAVCRQPNPAASSLS